MASHYRRFIVVASFVATPILALVTAAFEPDLSGSFGHQLSVIGTHRQSATVSAIAFVLMQLPMLVIAIFLSGALVRRGAHRLGNLAGSLVAVSAFAHSIIGGSMLITVTMSETSLDRKQMATLLLRIHHTAPYHLLALLGIAGFVLGWAFFTAALWRTRLIPRILSAAIPASSPSNS
jgi:hypothetical protein